jgi:hypothetical protein
VPSPRTPSGSPFGRLRSSNKHALARLARGETEPGLREFLAENKEKVEAYAKDRRSGQAPMRWTSNYLVQDVKLVAERYPDLTVKRAYDEMYVFSNWQIHGSGNIVNALGPDGIVAAMAISVTMCGQLSFQCIEMVRRLVGTFDLPAQKSLSAARKAWTDKGLEKLGFDAEDWATTAASSPPPADTRPQTAE